jgi:hypothetical protein
MAIEYNWEFGPISVKTVNGLNDVIVNLSWRCVAKDTETNQEAAESGFLNLDNPDPNSFVGLNDLTKNHLLSWIGNTQRQEIENTCLGYLTGIITANTREVLLDLK